MSFAKLAMLGYITPGSDVVDLEPIYFEPKPEIIVEKLFEEPYAKKYYDWPAYERFYRSHRGRRYIAGIDPV